ncbi:AAA family ATPase [Microcoleus sp. Pol10D4]|uniref:AAA family ATPase n=1 Tax=Microcoleus sp. Pol10D4 TaxID=3055387 RepID=UPI002FD43307
MVAIVAFVNQKGGCAKSTTAVHYAHWLVQQGKSVLVVDADAQRSSSQWCSKMEPAIATHVLQSPDDLLDQLTDLAATVDYLVVDGPAGLSEATRAILMRADLAVVPVQPSGIDVQSAADAVRLIKQAQSVRQGPPKAVMFLSRAVKGTKLKTEAMELLGKLTPTIKVLKSVIHQKQVIADSSGQAATVWDLGGQPAKDSGKEYSRLFKEIMGVLK